MDHNKTEHLAKQMWSMSTGTIWFVGDRSETVKGRPDAKPLSVEHGVEELVTDEVWERIKRVLKANG